MSISIRPIEPGETWVLRQAILRPHQSISQMRYPHDDDVDTIHFGAFEGDQHVGIVSIYRENHEQFAPEPAYRLRGMAVLPEMRGRGIGGELVDRCERHILESGANKIWCNARTSAERFYQRLGFGSCGDEFDIEGIGPHYVYLKSLS